MFCFKCGASMADAAPACPECGAAASDAPQIAPRVASAPAVSSYASLGTTQPYSIQPQTEGKATASMILGILSLTCFSALAGIPAVILGHLSKSNIRKSMGRLGGDGMATAGLIMGYISIGLLPFLLLAIISGVMQSRAMESETAAPSVIRTVNTAEVAYSISYPTAGYAHDLSILGPGPSGCSGDGNQQHACLVDAVLGCSQSWCVKDGYRFNLAAICRSDGACSDYVIVGVPLRLRTGAKSFCSTSDMVIRTKTDVSILAPPTASECQSWDPA